MNAMYGSSVRASSPILSLGAFLSRAVGVPFVPFGRGYDGWDCYGLIIAAYRDVLGVDLPDYAYESVRDYKRLATLFLDREASHYHRLARPEPMACACIYRRGLAIHAGLVVPGGRIVHVEEGIETCVEPLARFRVEGFYVPSRRSYAPVPNRDGR